jgi:hypothetical protein
MKNVLTHIFIHLVHLVLTKQLMIKGQFTKKKTSNIFSP